MGVLELWRYPVKAMLGERVMTADVGAGGLAGDRRWLVVDAVTGARIASKRGPTDPRLRACRAELITDGDGEAPVLRVTLPEGEVHEGAEVEGALSELLDRPVRLEAHTGRARGFAATGGHHDVAPLHLITTSTLAHLRTLAPAAEWDPRRFRPNLLVDDGPAPVPFREDALLGSVLRASSGAALAVGLPTPRCVVPTRAQEGLPARPEILRTIVQAHRVDLGPFGRPGCAGAYAEVSTPGRLAVGDRLEILDDTRTAPERAIAASLARIAARIDPGPEM
jgi:uncharacterized protein YcbX